jgi:membrane protein YqaA with SNARE-associated domain
VRAFSQFVIALCASPIGVVLLAALDSTLLFSLPLGIDAVVIILAARWRAFAWVVPLLATFGSALGAALTFWMGVEIGEHGLDRYVAARRLERLRARVRTSGTVALAALDLIPPPFPFTLFILAAGALEVNAWTFFVALSAFKLLRFGVETVLAVLYGRRILEWIASDLFGNVVAVLTMIAMLLLVLSAVRLLRSRARRGPSAA